MRSSKHPAAAAQTSARTSPRPYGGRICVCQSGPRHRAGPPRYLVVERRQVISKSCQISEEERQGDRDRHPVSASMRGGGGGGRVPRPFLSCPGNCCRIPRRRRSSVRAGFFFARGPMRLWALSPPMRTTKGAIDTLVKTFRVDAWRASRQYGSMRWAPGGRRTDSSNFTKTIAGPRFHARHAGAEDGRANPMTIGDVGPALASHQGCDGSAATTVHVRRTGFEIVSRHIPSITPSHAPRAPLRPVRPWRRAFSRIRADMEFSGMEPIHAEPPARMLYWRRPSAISVSDRRRSPRGSISLGRFFSGIDADRVPRLSNIRRLGPAVKAKAGTLCRARPASPVRERGNRRSRCARRWAGGGFLPQLCPAVLSGDPSPGRTAPASPRARNTSPGRPRSPPGRSPSACKTHMVPRTLERGFVRTNPTV